jgi:xanthine/uracil permease
VSRCLVLSDKRMKLTALYVVAMVTLIVAIDFLFFKNRFWERLAVNVGIVLVFAAFYFRFLKRP